MDGSVPDEGRGALGLIPSPLASHLQAKSPMPTSGGTQEGSWRVCLTQSRGRGTGIEVGVQGATGVLT